DLPFGRRTLKLTSGAVIDIPNVIRTVLPSRLIVQYNQYCEESSYQPLSRTTLFRILSESCVASVRKSLQGLDNYAAEGGRGFDDLISILDTLLQYGAGDAMIRHLKDQLRQLKQYIKGDYKTLVQVKSEVMSTKLPQDIQDDALFTTHTACDAILAWKSHQLRMVHQDKARTDVLETLEADTVLIIQDFAMKFLPAQYRETQAEFFGKRGISWHITVCQSRVNNVLVAETFVHIIESGIQDSKTVVTVMEHVLQTLKREHPELSNVYYRQDNAGCYHSASTILACKVLRDRTGLDLRQFDFCDPQGGKGPCDRKSAQIKTHIKAYINQGHSVTTASEMKTAIESNDGIPGVRVVRVVAPRVGKAAKETKIKWDGVSSFSNFVLTTQGIRAFKAYNIGEGHFWSWTGFDGIPKGDSFDWITDDVGEGGFIPVKHRQVKETRQPVICSNTELDDDSSDPVLTSDSHLFVCPEDGCVKSYISHGRLEQHLMFGKHEFRLERTRLMDKAKVRYAERLEAGALGCISISNISGRKQGTGTPCTLTQGWAHRETSKRHTRFSAKQKAYLENKFQVGERTGVKANPEDVAKEMRCVRDDTDQRVFRVEEFLRPAQITSYFSRMAAKRKVPVTASDDEAEEYRRHQTAARDNVIHALQEIESRHPILYSRTNLCSLEEKQIAAFKMTQLRSIVNHFGVTADGRTKIAFVEAITSFLSKCSCKY
ncbi:hypothetical protein QZH41_017016, partial [Actinostola sp. cb2023]